MYFHLEKQQQKTTTNTHTQNNNMKYCKTWVILLKTGPKRVPFPDEIKIKLKHETFLHYI